MTEPYRCTACHRPEHMCSADPCPAVQSDRGEIEGYDLPVDDGHEHDFVVCDGLPDTGTDAEPVICTRCGLLSVEEPE